MQSDHHLIGLLITLTEFPRGRGYWTFCQALLDHNLFLEKTKEFIHFLHLIGTAVALLYGTLLNVLLEAIQYNTHH
jgi:hypothetical protein